MDTLPVLCVGSLKLTDHKLSFAVERGGFHKKNTKDIGLLSLTTLSFLVLNKTDFFAPQDRLSKANETG